MESLPVAPKIESFLIPPLIELARTLPCNRDSFSARGSVNSSHISRDSNARFVAVDKSLSPENNRESLASRINQADNFAFGVFESKRVFVNGKEKIGTVERSFEDFF